ncbi:hypothetical protein CkaCkLH20_06580 [Colletotrichum karsti]|uniref:Heterokaryon incompatibility domain-containing protein n=1 Tax=Colletotrichum karsti TaxID=1095194 RepID=A0A9P6LHC8_9PEZI|nr:uncharacterized protein CkaCkLH20_06580 [Colletotrichum karsti]KAF9876134.1 hypothetical protein CkaCkLH20_06580 [Colletotrichum karsti]
MLSPSLSKLRKDFQGWSQQELEADVKRSGRLKRRARWLSSEDANVTTAALLGVKWDMADVHEGPDEVLDRTEGPLRLYDIVNGVVEDWDGAAYWTLSYVWGEWEQKGDGRPSVAMKKQLEILPSILGITKIWIDALCIRQDDSQEVQKQIAVMGAIYRKSLGAVAMIPQLEGLGIERIPANTTRAKAQKWGRKVEKKLEESVWMSRIWTFQEAVLPPRLLMVWGESVCSFATLMWLMREVQVGTVLRPGKIIPHILQKSGATRLKNFLRSGDYGGEVEGCSCTSGLEVLHAGQNKWRLFTIGATRLKDLGRLGKLTAGLPVGHLDDLAEVMSKTVRFETDPSTIPHEGTTGKYSHKNIHQYTANPSTTDRKTETSPRLTEISIQQGWDNLKHKPRVLQSRSLFIAIASNCAILAALAMVPQTQSANINTSAYYGFNVLLVLVGTATAAHLEYLALNLSRVAPFMLCATEQGASARDTVLRRYFPAPPVWNAWWARDWLLLSSHTMYWLSYLIIVLDSVVFYKEVQDLGGVVSLRVNATICHILVIVYCVIQLYLALLICSLWNKTTGLRWDPDTMADILALFRYSDFRDRFEGSSVATPSSMLDQLGDMSIRLGYWQRENGDYWHGFGSFSKGKGKEEMLPISGENIPSGPPVLELRHMRQETSTENPSSQAKPIEKPPKAPDTKYQTETITKQELARLRHNPTSTPTIARPPTVLITAFLAAGLAVLFIAGIALTSPSDESEEFCWELPALERTWAHVIFDAIPMALALQISYFWNAFSLFMAHTEPFARMSDQSTNTAARTLLFEPNRARSPLGIRDSFKHNHHKLARVTLCALLYKVAMPPLTASGIVVYEIPETRGSKVCFHRPTSVLCAAAFALFAIRIFLEGLRDIQPGRTPRTYSTIADLLSWASASEALKLGPKNHDAARRQQPWDDPLRLEVEGEQSERWWMEKRLEMKMNHVHIGFGRVPGREHFAFGFTDEEPEILPRVKTSGGFRRVEVDSEEGVGGEELAVVVGSSGRRYEILRSRGGGGGSGGARSTSSEAPLPSEKMVYA